MTFRIQLELFQGPLDLLLYLVKKQELDVIEIEITAVTEQYLEHVAVLEQIDVDAAGDFIDTASLLIEMKSRAVLPTEEVAEVELEDPRQELVRRLLEYKRYRDAASMLEERSREWRERFPRSANDLSVRQVQPEQQPIQEVELWDLVSAFGRVLKAKNAAVRRPESIRYDETPVHTYMRWIDERLHRDGRVPFTSFFDASVHKSKLVGMFLAVLELVRHQHARAAQQALFEEIWLELGEKPLPSVLAPVADYEHGTAPAEH
jgi:segregation and condensation protein A